MIATDENALICDLAETYCIYDYRSLPAKLAATYSAGLREDSRIKMLMRGDLLGDGTRMLVGMVYDALVAMSWAGEGKPPQIALDAMYNGRLPEKAEEKKQTKSFDSPEEYERARKKIIERRQRCQT